MPKHANTRERIQQGFFDVYALLLTMGHGLGCPRIELIISMFPGFSDSSRRAGGDPPPTRESVQPVQPVQAFWLVELVQANEMLQASCPIRTIGEAWVLQMLLNGFRYMSPYMWRLYASHYGEQQGTVLI